ncbi:hypothetical protein OROMI_032723 [Orobanche minor]
MSVFSNDTVSAGIRAPLTIDESDFEYSLSPRSRRNSIGSSYCSNSELESEGFVSGEDDSETMPCVTGQDEEIIEETHFVHEFGFHNPSVVRPNGETVRVSSFSNVCGFSRPSVTDPYDNFAKESGIVHRNAFFRPFVGNPDGEFARETGDVNRNSFSRPFVGSPDVKTCNVISDVDGFDDSRSFSSESCGEFVENEVYVPDSSGSRPIVTVTDEENLENSPALVVDIIKVSEAMLKSHIPIAKISRESDDDDDDDQGSEDLENERTVDIIRVPSSEVLHGLNTALKVRMLEGDEGNDDYEPQAESMVEMEFVKDMVISSCVSGPKDEKEHNFGEDDIIKCVITSNTVQDRVNKPYNIDEETQETDAIDNRKKYADSVGHSNTVLEDNFVFSQSVESEKLEIEREREEIFEDLPLEFLGLPKALTENVLANMYDSILGDECQSVSKVATLDQETAKEAVYFDELSGELKSKAMMVETDRDSITLSNEEISLDHSQGIDCQIVTDSDNSVVKPPQSGDGVENFSPDCISGDFGSLFSSTLPIIEERSETEKKTKLEKIQHAQVEYLRLVDQFSRFQDDFVASNVLGQLSDTEAKPSFPAFSLDSAATELQARQNVDLGFSLCILVIGKTGVGKSATINSIFRQNKTSVNAFEPSMTRVKEINGEIYGVKVKVFDTPGLSTCPIDQKSNRKLLSSIKKLMRKSPMDVILYVDRLDTQLGSLNDLPLLKSITSCLGSSIWRKSVLAFTHANLVPPDGPAGYPLSYEEFIDQQSRSVRQLIRQLSGEMNNDLTVPVSLVENHPSAKETKENGEEEWRFKLLFSFYSKKILSESRSVVRVDSPMDNAKDFFKYRFLEPSCRMILTRPVFESYCDCGYDGVLVGDSLDVWSRPPAVFSIRLAKDKKDLKLNVSLGSNKKLSGKISVKTGGLDPIQIAALTFFPIAKAVFDKIFRQSVED